MTLLIAGLVLFIATHLLRPFAPGLRNAGVAALGKPAWMALHGIVSLASLVLIAYGFADARANGGEMLVAQAAIAFERWTGIGGMDEVMRAAVQPLLDDPSAQA